MLAEGIAEVERRLSNLLEDTEDNRFLLLQNYLSIEFGHGLDASQRRASGFALLRQLVNSHTITDDLASRVMTSLNLGSSVSAAAPVPALAGPSLAPSVPDPILSILNFQAMQTAQLMFLLHQGGNPIGSGPGGGPGR